MSAIRRTTSKGALALAALCLLGATAAPAAPEYSRLEVDHDQVRRWNRFADALHALHRYRVERRAVETAESTGGYADDPEFYREVRYRDAETGRLLSRIQWERARPERVHMIEVRIYDDRGRLTRDYLAAYLPRHRNAPVQTLINFHGYDDELHGFRQFDASGRRIYEQCRGEHFGEEVFISLEEHELPPYATPGTGALGSPAYVACFEDVPLAPGRRLDPLSELPRAADLRVAEADGAGPATTDDAERRLARAERALQSRPEDAGLYLRRGRARLNLRELEGAIEDFTRAIALDDTLDDAYLWRGMARGRAGELDSAVADLTVYLRSNPKDSHGFTKRGVRHLWQGDLRSAEMDFRRAIALDPGNAEAHDDLGVILANRREYDRAHEQFTTVVELDPGYQKGWHNLAMVHYLTGRHERALHAVNESLRLAPNDGDGLRLKGQILLATGREQEALALFERADFAPGHKHWTERFPAQ